MINFLKEFFLLLFSKKKKKKKKKKILLFELFEQKKKLFSKDVRRVDQLSLALWVKFSVDDTEIFFSYFFKKQVLTLSRTETICTKCHSLFSEEK